MVFFTVRVMYFILAVFFKQTFNYFHRINMSFKTCLFIALLFIAGTAFLPPDAMKVKWLVLKSSVLRVDGSTNINTFNCMVPDYASQDTLTCTKNPGRDPGILMTGHLSLPVFSFDCHNSMMTADLRKTLKAKSFPMLNISFLSLKKFPELKTTPENISGWVNIELAGVMKKYEVSYTLSMDEQKIIHLVGTRSINFSDFNITPPKKLGGIIQTRDRLDVAFHLSLKNVGL